MRISDCISDVCSSDLTLDLPVRCRRRTCEAMAQGAREGPCRSGAGDREGALSMEVLGEVARAVLLTADPHAKRREARGLARAWRRGALVHRCDATKIGRAHV